MKRAALSLSLAMTFLFSIAVYTVLIASVIANPHPPPTPVIAIQSPTAFVNVHDVQLAVSAKVPSYGSSGGFEGIKLLNYSLDGQPAIPLTLEFQGEIKTAINDTTNPFNGDPYNLYIGRSTLAGLSDGQHYLTVDGESVFNKPLHVTASFVVDTVHPKLKVLSPLPTKTYFSTNVTLEYQVDESISWAGYSLDGNPIVTSRINTTLTNLSYRTHVITVQANDSAGNLCLSPTIVFTVKDIDPPTISILSAGNEYNTTDVPLNFTINENITWITYSLDDQANVTVTGNATLTGLSSGSHSLRVYANDTAGNIGASQTFDFTIAQKMEPQQSETFPATFAVAASATTLAVVGGGLVIYFKKRKH